jgi:N-carbamoylputrescine amidase
MTAPHLTVALVHDVFFEDDGAERLLRRLVEAREAGAALALLPELPLHAWIGSSRIAREEDAEPPAGPRQRRLSSAAREAGIAVVGGAIVREAGRRFNRALLFDSRGELMTTYDKLHLPSEEGFWESDHYEPGLAAPEPVEACGFRIGIQVCSDVQRPSGCNLLGARGASLIAVPRATPPGSFERWRTVLRANAVTSGTYLISVNRPAGRDAVAMGSPSIAIAPDGTVLAETTEPVTTVVLERAAVAAARADYPGYLAVRADVYARAWADVASRQRDPD